MKYMNIVFVCLFTSLTFLMPGVGRADQAPDIVLIMADDLGFSDIGCYGSEIPTPHLDRLAEGGVRFTEFANTSRCCPSRASLLTGLYSHQAGVGDMNYKDRGPGYRGQLLNNVPTIAERLRQVGYGTAMVGKWHLTRANTLDKGPNGSWPLQRGFDRFFGTLEGAKNYFRPKWLFDDRNPVTEVPKNFFYTDAIAKRAANYIREQEKGKPLFLYAAFYAPHFPLQAPKVAIDKFRGKYCQGWDALRKERLQRQQKMGIVPPNCKLSNRANGVPAWSELSPGQQNEMDLRMAIYAAQVHLLDQGIGLIIEALQKTGRLDNTLLIFLSDNGGTKSGGPLGSGRIKRLGGIDAALKSTYGAGWANLSNTPFRFFKANVHEGGVRAPLLLHWPKGLDEKGTIRKDIAHIIDIAPTCLTVANANAPLEGKNLLEKSDRQDEPRALFFEHEGSRGVRQGHWKLVNRDKSNEWELYDLRSDPIEALDLASEQPEEVQRLSTLWYEWAKRCHVRFNPKSKHPNVLWIVSDDLSPDLACYNTKAVSTPNLDRLASSGVRYTSAFATSPTCSPSRTAFITGMYQTTLGGHHHRTRNKPQLPEGVVPVTEHFRKAGYFVCNMGNPTGKAKGKTDYNFAWEGMLYDGSDWSKRCKGQPFFAQLQIKQPHRDFVKNEDPTRPSRLQLPPTYPDHPLVRADWANYLESVEVMDRKVGEVLQRLDKEGLAENTIVFFFGDHGRPMMWGKQWLYDAGIRVPLIVRWPGRLKTGSVERRLVSLIDVGPTSLVAAGLEVPKTMQGRDFLSPTSQPRDIVIAARDRCGDAPDRVRCLRTDHLKYIRNFDPEQPYTQLSSYKKLQYPGWTLLRVLHEQKKLTPVQDRFFAKTRPREELYDIVADPLETKNLATDPGYSNQLKEFRQRLDEWMEQTDDLGRFPEGDDTYVRRLRDEKRRWYEGVMRRRKLSPDISDEQYLQWWENKLLSKPKGNK